MIELDDRVKRFEEEYCIHCLAPVEYCECYSFKAGAVRLPWAMIVIIALSNVLCFTVGYFVGGWR